MPVDGVVLEIHPPQMGRQCRSVDTAMKKPEISVSKYNQKTINNFRLNWCWDGNWWFWAEWRLAKRACATVLWLYFVSQTKSTLSYFKTCCKFNHKSTTWYYNRHFGVAAAVGKEPVEFTSACVWFSSQNWCWYMSDRLFMCTGNTDDNDYNGSKRWLVRNLQIVQFLANR